MRHLGIELRVPAPPIARSSSPRSVARSWLPAADADGVVLAAEAETVGEADVDAALGTHVSCGVGDVIEIEFGIRIGEVHRWWHDAGLDCFHACHQFNGTGGLDQVAQHAFHAAEWDFFCEIAEERFHGDGFDAVVFLCAGAVCGDVVHAGAAVHSLAR